VIVPQHRLHASSLKAYDALAPFYDRYWGPAFLEDAVRLFRRFLASRLRASPLVLDLCCGAGHFSAWLESAGLQVTGVDASRSMIDFARQKAPQSHFHVADMQSFSIPSVFSAAVCFYNSINQVLTSDALRSTLRSVAEHIEPGGWFLFDVVLEEGYTQSWHADEAVAFDGRACDLTYRYDEREALATCRVTVRDSAETSATGSYEFFQRPHPLPLLLKKLHQCGFDFIEVAKATGFGPSEGRVAITARRDPDTWRRPKRPPPPSVQIQCQENELCLTAHDR